MKKINFVNEFTVDCTKFITNPGNGHAVPQYELDKNGKVVPVIDKETGEQVVHSLYDDIQKNKHANDYKKMLESGVDPMIYAAKSDETVDLTKCGSGVDLLKAEQAAKSYGYNTIDDIFAAFRDFMLKKQQVERAANHKQNEKKDSAPANGGVNEVK